MTPENYKRDIENIEEKLDNKLEFIREDIRDMRKDIKRNNEYINEVDKSRIEDSGRVKEDLAFIRSDTKVIAEQTKELSSGFIKLQELLMENDERQTKRIEEMDSKHSGKFSEMEEAIVGIQDRRGFNGKVVGIIITSVVTLMTAFFQFVVPYIFQLLEK